MRANAWYFDPVSAAKSKQQSAGNKQSKNNPNQSRSAATKASTSTKTSAAAGTTTTTTSGNSEILDLITAMNAAKTTGNTQAVSSLLLTSKSGGADFLLGDTEQQGSWGICYALSSMYSIAREATASLSKVKSLFSVMSNGDIQVTFAKSINGNPFTAAQIKAGLNKETITAADLQYIYTNNMYTKSAESAGDVLSLAYGKLLVDLKANKKIASTTAQAVSAADGGAVTASNATTSDVFMKTLGMGAASYTNITTTLTDSALLASIKNTINAKGAVTATTLKTGTQLTPAHAYSVMGVDANNNIIIHNPWGIDGTTGNLSPDSNTNDGLITLTLAQFRANFSYISTVAA